MLYHEYGIQENVNATSFSRHYASKKLPLFTSKDDRQDSKPRASQLVLTGLPREREKEREIPPNVSVVCFPDALGKERRSSSGIESFKLVYRH